MASDIGSGTLVAEPLTDASRLKNCGPVVVMVITSVKANKPSVTAVPVPLPFRLTLLSRVQPLAQPGFFRVLLLSRYDLTLTSAEAPPAPPAKALVMLPVNWVSQLDAPAGDSKPVPVKVMVRVPPEPLERSNVVRSR